VCLTDPPMESQRTRVGPGATDEPVLLIDWKGANGSINSASCSVTHAQPGLRRDNWSLLEFALLDLKHNQILLQAEGRGWGTLDRPSAPGINQWYPAVYLRPQDERHIWPPTYEGAPNTLRVVSFDQAAKRLVLKLRNSWLVVLESDATARKSRSWQTVASPRAKGDGSMSDVRGLGTSNP
jgi:hypothetical protein